MEIHVLTGTKPTIEFIVTRGQFTSPTSFSEFIEQEAVRRGISPLESMLEYCTDQNIEPHALAKSLTPELKRKIQLDGESLNILKRRTSQISKPFDGAQECMALSVCGDEVLDGAQEFMGPSIPTRSTR